MNFVEPIRDRKKITQIKNLLRGEKRYRDLLLFVVGINTALRVSDLLQLQIGDFVDEQGALRDRFWLREEKRGKRNEVIINDSMSEVIGKYLIAYPTRLSRIPCPLRSYQSNEYDRVLRLFPASAIY